MQPSNDTPTTTPTAINVLAAILAAHLTRDPRAFIRALIAEALRPFGTFAAWGEHIEATRPGWGPDREWSFPDPRGLHEDDTLALTAALTWSVTDGVYRDEAAFANVWTPIITHRFDRSEEWNRRALLVREAARLASEIVLNGHDVSKFAGEATYSMLLSFAQVGDAEGLVKRITRNCEAAQHATCDAAEVAL
jgi:hypothetical protein